MHFMRYYRAGVLAMFQSQTDKYDITIDEFEGRVQVTNHYYEEAQRRGEECYLNVSFGFRACLNGEWAVAAYSPDLEKASSEEETLWRGFRLGDDAFPEDLDSRFGKWFERYIMGSWDVPESPLAGLQRIAEQVNAITVCTVGMPLFRSPAFRRLCFPLAENNHRYHDAHSGIYKIAIDGLNKDAITALGTRLGVVVRAGDKTTVNALEQIMTETLRPAVRAAFDQISAQRRLADHKERPQAARFAAFEAFAKDMNALVAAFETLRDDLAQRLDVNIERCERRASALRLLPEFDPQRPPQPNYGIFPAFQMEGKRIEAVRAGEIVATPGRSKSEEALVLQFDDGSLVAIETATNNLSELVRSGGQINPEDVNIRFYVTYVPPMLPFAGAESEGDGAVKMQFPE
jgi:hypothetical protein